MQVNLGPFLTSYACRLSRIVANILRDLYSIRPPPMETQYELAKQYSKEISAWRKTIAYLVDNLGPGWSLMQPIFFRQSNTLNMACWHAQLLVHRPFLLRNFASLADLGATRRSRTPHNAEKTEENIRLCLEAAMNIVSLVDSLKSQDKLYSTLWVGSTGCLAMDTAY